MPENKLTINITNLLKEVFESVQYTTFTVEIEDINTDYHIGANLVFAKLHTIDTHEKSEDIYVAIKVGKVKISPDVPVENLRESFFYEKIIPIFMDMQKEKNVDYPFKNFPKCYKTLIYGDYEVLILENLKSRGYDLVQEVNVNDHNHRIMVKTLAKYHALSFALKHFKKEEFNELTKNCKMPNKVFVNAMTDVFQNVLDKIRFNLETAQKMHSLAKFTYLMEAFNGGSLLQMIDNVPKQTVLVHGDYHKYNMLFKFKEEDSEEISDVTLIDFQVAGVHSPVLDLSYYFYSIEALGSGNFELSDFLKYYYQELSLFLKQLGCNVESCFSFITLINHWKKYSFYGFCFMASLVVFRFIDSSNTTKRHKLNISHVKEEQKIAKMVEFFINDSKIAEIDRYNEALVKIGEKYLTDLDEISF